MSGHHHKHPNNAVGALLVVVAESIIEVFLVCVVGYILARKGILTASVRKSLNRINVAVLTPSLLFSKVAFSLTPDKLTELWIVPVGFVIVTVTSILIAYIFGKVLRLKRSQTYFAMAVSSAPNSNSLPIAFMQSLVYSIGELAWGDDDTKDEMLGRALSYLVVFSTLGIIYRWSLAVKLLSVADEPNKPILPDTRHAQVMSPPALDAEQEEAPFFAPANPGDDSNPTSPASFHTKRFGKSHVFNSFPNTPDWRTPAHSSFGDSDSDQGGRHKKNGSAGSEADERSDSDSEWGASHGSGRRNGTKPSRSKSQKQLRRSWSSFKSFSMKWVLRPTLKALIVIKEFMTVPLYAALLSLIVCCIPPLQKFLDTLTPLRGALKQAGNCSIPLTLLVLGGFMHQEDKKEEKSSTAGTAEDRDGRKKFASRKPVFARGASLRRSTAPAKKGEGRTVAVGILSRMILTPAALLPLLYLYSLNKDSVADDPVFIVTACLVIGSPPALTLAQITEASAGDAFERLISKTMLYAYGLLTAPTTVALVILGLLIDRADRGM